MQQAGVNLRQRATEAPQNGTPDYGSEGIYNAPQTMTYPMSPQPQYTGITPQPVADAESARALQASYLRKSSTVTHDAFAASAL